MDLSSGLSIAEPAVRLLAFCHEEYAYYDGIASGDPDRVDPIDVLATVSMNSRVNDAAGVRSVHRGLSAACEPILPHIPEDADLLDFDLGVVEELLDAACRVHGVLIAVATKVLHRKRRRLIPMLDSVLIDHYLAIGVETNRAWLGYGTRAAGAVMPVLKAFRADLGEAAPDLEGLSGPLVAEGFRLTSLRMLELLIWMEREPRGYYRSA
ncbi:MAG: DUF6308 family protein [Actinomycetota bacterium]